MYVWTVQTKVNETEEEVRKAQLVDIGSLSFTLFFLGAFALPEERLYYFSLA